MLLSLEYSGYLQVQSYHTAALTLWPQVVLLPNLLNSWNYRSTPLGPAFLIF